MKVLHQPWRSLTLGLLIACLAGCNREEEPPAETVRPVLSILATPAAVPNDGYSGIIEPRYQTDASFRLLGRILTRDVDVGDTVQSDQLIATIDPELQQLAVRSAEASLTNARVQRANAEAKLDRQEKLTERNATSQSDLEAARNNEEAAVAEVTQAEANLAKAKEDLTYTRLKSDIDGVVMSIDAERDETVTAGETVATIANPAIREAVVDIGEDEIRMIQPGTDFRVLLQKNDDVEMIGTVREIAPQADQKTRTRRVRISLTDPPEGFRLGSTILAQPITITNTDIRVPIDTILVEEGQSFVWVVNEKSSTVSRRPVTLSRRDDKTADLAEGIEVGDRVVTAGVHSLQEGQQVRWNTDIISGPELNE
ncbi:efflux RND transporter periplasmic adaptor subunit [Rubripirellula reticaptiva]|uniref:Macrolide export protein MacA n=1 Tax=Rubripirellula reticaptiva TaxID=2528013 RepID=A0A5C6EHA9_9BACT|nr:efflux RND transporter periplasmic adaptor subunit [Rubripirellula reticaptiva]TWU48198.1 Macrolide export protein MacA [Rubripirellula reticaptiva]